MSKHTKGPWKVGVKHEVKCDGFDGADTDTAYFITSEGYQDKSECEANARLIAAAPEMFEALKGMTRIVEAFGYTNTLGKTQLERLAIAKALINKTEGE